MFCPICGGVSAGGACLRCRPPAPGKGRSGHVSMVLRTLNSDGGLDGLILAYTSLPTPLNILVERVKPEAVKRLGRKTTTPAGDRVLYYVVYFAAQQLVEKKALSFGVHGYERKGLTT